jgi:hypothetical protein
MIMIMKQLSFRILVCVVALLSVLSAGAEVLESDTLSLSSAYEQRVERYRKSWNYLIPRYAKVQYAGGMGLFSVGMGWDYGKNGKWETDLLFGIIPKYSSKNAKVTMTIKENYTPWSVSLGKGWAFQPLETGIYLNTVFSNKFWTHEPSRYPRNYYGFSTRIRGYLFVGQRWQYKFPNSAHKFAQSISAFYELSTCDFLVVTAVQNSYLKPTDYLRLSFGVKLQIL